MKVQSEVVLKFIQSLRYQVLGIRDTVKSGDDGFEDTCVYQVEEILKTMDVFTLESLTPVSESQPTKRAKSYLKKAEDILIRRGNGEEPTGGNEATILFQERLYHFIKWEWLASVKVSDITNKDLYTQIEIFLAESKTFYAKAIYSNEWFYTSMGVIQDVVDEIVEQREKAPQQTLFDT